jgi:hypothetical protein
LFQKAPKMNKQFAAGKRKHGTLMIPQQLQILQRLESGETQSLVMASYNIGPSTVCDIKKRKGHL